MQHLIVPLRPRNVRQEGLRLIAFGGMMAVAGGMALMQGSAGGFSLFRVFGFIVGINGLFSLGIGLWQVVRGREAGDIELDADRLLAFPSEWARRRISVPLTEIRSLSMRADDRRARLYIGTRRGLVVIDGMELADPDRMGRLALALRERIGRLPNGQERLSWFGQQVEQARVVAARRPIVTYVLLAVIALVFGIQTKMGATTDALQMMRLGAGVPALIAQGEWYRLVSANALHGLDVHFAVNGLALWFLGALLERMTGAAALTVVALSSALGGALTSTLLSGAPMMVGASTALYGLAGALVVIHRVYRWQIPPMFQESLKTLIILLIVNVVITLPVPQIDKAAHLGGFVVGALAMFMMIPKDKRYRPLVPPSATRRAVAIGLGLLFVAGLGRAGQTALDFKPEPALRVLLDDPDIAPVMLNNTAWTTLVQPDADRATLETCLKMAQVAVARTEAEPPPADAPAEVRALFDSVLSTYLDTRAGAQFRLGQVEPAIADELRAFGLDAEARGIYVAHLLRMLDGLPPKADLSRAGEALRAADTTDGDVVLAVATAGPVRGLIVGRPDAQGRMQTEKSGLAPEAQIQWLWTGKADVARRVPAGEWRFFEQVDRGELP